MKTTIHRRALGLAALCLAAPFAASALNFEVPGWDDQAFEGVLNTTVTAGGAWRTQKRSADLVGKSNLDPNVCGRFADGHTLYQSCQGLFRTQTFPAEKLAAAPGQYTVNADDGNLNYGKGDLTQAPLKVTSDLTLSRGDFGIFVKGLWFYDFVNNDFTERHPNRITPDNVERVGKLTFGPPAGGGLGTEVLPLARTESRPCPADRNPGGSPCGLVYGAGAPLREKRRDAETLREIGTDLQLLDAFVFGKLPLWGERELTVKLGRQTVNWGESTLLVFNSINTVNPINANNFFRTGFQVEEVFQPVGMLFASTELLPGVTLEGFYQYEWKPLEAPAPGSFFSFLDLGTNDAIDNVNIGFGGGAEDPQQQAALLDNPLSGLTNTTSTAQRLPDKEPEGGGQYGASLRYYADWLNDGTELGLYFTNTHARSPYASVYSVDRSCAKDTRNTVGFLTACPDIPLLHGLTSPNDPFGATDSAVPFDTLKIQLEYPEDIRMYGLSFNTTAGEFSLQGEVAYRPDEPLQVDTEDLAFAGFGPTLSNCHLPETGCAGTGTGTGLVTGLLPAELQPLIGGLLNTLGTSLGLPTSLVGGVGTFTDPSQCAQQNGAPVTVNDRTCLYPASDFVTDAAGTRGSFNDSYDLLIGHMVGSGRAFPSFIIPYRGGVIGTNPANSYIRGWEHFDTYQFNFGGTYIMGATDNPIGADQIITLFETGATWVPDLPPYDELQLEGPGTYNHASAGADGSGGEYTDERSRRQACSSNAACSYGPDGGRFNPHQQDRSGYPDKLSWGYVLISLIRYESVLPGISFQPQIIWKHDVQGTAPGLASNFVEGRKAAALVWETRYKSSVSFNLGYTWFTGGGVYNLQRDRDFAQAFVKLQF